MSISQYVIGGSLLATALAVGYAKWNDLGVAAKTAKAETAIVKAECVSSTAAEVTESLRRQIEARDKSIEEQRTAIAELTKKSNDRLRENNDLRRKIANVPNDQNTPVSPHLELLLDQLRSPVSRDGSGAGSSDQGGNDGASDSAGRDVPPEAKPAPEAPGS